MMPTEQQEISGHILMNQVGQQSKCLPYKPGSEDLNHRMRNLCRQIGGPGSHMLVLDFM